MVDSNLLSQNLQEKATLATSRRSFLAGSRLALGAAFALSIGLAAKSSPAKADDCGFPGNGGVEAPQSGNPGQANGCKCFLSGTRIETSLGPVNVENLKIGELVLTNSGTAKPVKWIGKRQFERASDPGAAPVKISRFAIDGKAPSADLYVSPAHAIYIDGILIPAVNLVNGITICANGKPEIETITYYHVELDTHEVILAEGLAVETLLRTSSASGFDNEHEYVAVYGVPTEPMRPYAPIVGYYGGRQELASHVRSALAPVYDFRKPIDKVRDRLAGFAELARAA